MFGERERLFGFWRTCVALARQLNFELRNGTFFVNEKSAVFFPAFVDLSKLLLREQKMMGV
jgi:hypothetical protein